MRKRTVRNGMRLVMASLILIILASFYHGSLSDLLSLSSTAELRIYRLGIFWAAAIGGYGVVLVAFGFILAPQKGDQSLRILPLFLLIVGLVSLFFYLLAASFDVPTTNQHRQLQSGETLTI